MTFKLTNADNNAIILNDSNFINNKGAALYKEDTYKESVEYYRLSSAMGNDQATSNLGYCYLYGRGIKANTSLAIAYFKIASHNKNIDATYKLGDIYSSDKWGLKDNELSIYYYQLASEMIVPKYNNDPYHNVRYAFKLERYPSLCFALGREYYSGEHLSKDLDFSYLFLKHALVGYERALNNGDDFYKECYLKVKELLEDHLFIDISNRYTDEYYDEDYIEED